MTISTNVLYFDGINWLALDLPSPPVTPLTQPIPIDAGFDGGLTATAITSDTTDNLYISGDLVGYFSGTINLKYNPTDSSSTVLGGDLQYDEGGLQPALTDNLGSFNTLAVHSGKLYAGGENQNGKVKFFSYGSDQWLPLSSDTVLGAVNNISVVNYFPTEVTTPVTPPPVYDVDAQAVILYIEQEGSLSQGRKALINETVIALKDSNLWNKLDSLFILNNTPTYHSPSVDWKRQITTGTFPSSQADAMFTPSIDGVNYTQDSASMGIFIKEPVPYENNLYEANEGLHGSIDWVGRCNFDTVSDEMVYNDIDFTRSGVADYYSNTQVVDSVGNVYIIGYLANIPGIFKWDGTTWTTLPSIPNLPDYPAPLPGYVPPISEIIIDSHDNIYIRQNSYYSPYPTYTPATIHKWDGATWTYIAVPSIGADAYLLHVDNNDLLYAAWEYSGGYHSWNGASWDLELTDTSWGRWSGVTLQFDSTNNVYTLDSISPYGDPQERGVWKWNGSFWINLTSFTGGTVYPHHFTILSDDRVVIIGQFENVPELTDQTTGVILYDNGVRTSLGLFENCNLPSSNSVTQIAKDSTDNVYISCSRSDYSLPSTINGTPFNCYTKWNGTNWSDVGYTGPQVLNMHIPMSILSDNYDNIYYVGMGEGGSGYFSGIAMIYIIRADVTQQLVELAGTNTFSGSFVTLRHNWATQVPASGDCFSIVGNFSRAGHNNFHLAGAGDVTSGIELYYNGYTQRYYYKINSDQISQTPTGQFSYGGDVKPDYFNPTREIYVNPTGTSPASGKLVITRESDTVSRLWIDGVNVHTSSQVSTSLPARSVYGTGFNGSPAILSQDSLGHVENITAFFLGGYLTETEIADLTSIIQNYLDTTHYTP